MEAYYSIHELDPDWLARHAPVHELNGVRRLRDEADAHIGWLERDVVDVAAIQAPCAGFFRLNPLCCKRVKGCGSAWSMSVCVRCPGRGICRGLEKCTESWAEMPTRAGLLCILFRYGKGDLLRGLQSLQPQNRYNSPTWRPRRSGETAEMSSLSGLLAWKIGAVAELRTRHCRSAVLISMEGVEYVLYRHP